MRKFTAVELVVIAAGLVTTERTPGQTPGEENIPTMATVNSVGSYNTVTNFVFNTPGGSNLVPGSAPTAVSKNNSNSQARLYHALQCAYVYGKDGYKGSKPGWSTYITNNYGWRSNADPPAITTTTSSSAPDGYPVSIGGVTYGGSAPYSYVFLGSNPTMSVLIRSLAHEYSHQWGAADRRDGSANDAYAIGDYAVNQYLADNGKKCGGLLD